MEKIAQTTTIPEQARKKDETRNGFHSLEILPMDQYNTKLVANVHPPQWVNPTPALMYNLVVIGSGSAGLVAATGAAGLGAKVALIERHLVGGDCLNIKGCVPSKSLIRPAKVVGEIALGAEMGITISGEPKIDFGRVMERMRRVRADISEHDSAHRFKELGIDLFFGEGQTSTPNAVEVVSGEHALTLNFKKAVICTGTRSMPLPVPGLEETGYLTNETVFQLTQQPKSLAVIGAGPIGAELAQALRRFGSDVVVFDIIPRLLGREDPDAAAVIAEVFAREGIRTALGAKTKQVSKGAEGKTIQYELDGEDLEVMVDEILVAAGRIPNLEGLNLEAAGVEYHKKGVTVAETLQTTNANVYAVGDVAYKYQFTHTADATARIVLQNALFPGPKKRITDLVVPWCTYTDPEVAHVGMYAQDAQDAGIEVETIVESIGETDRGRVDAETEGFVKVHVKKGSDKILGATIVAAHAGEMINEITVAMVMGAGLKKMATVIHPYPTQAEAIKKAADAYNRKRLTPSIKRLFSAWLNWTRR